MEAGVDSGVKQPKVERKVDLEGPGQFELSPGLIFRVEGFAAMRTVDGTMRTTLLNGGIYATPFGAPDSPNWILMVQAGERMSLTFEVDHTFNGELCKRMPEVNDPAVEAPRAALTEAVAGVGLDDD